MEIKSVGVLGSGVIGIGVAQSLAETGHRVVLIDQSEQVLERSRAELRNNFRLFALFDKSKQKENVEVLLDRINFSNDFHALDSCQFVIENVTENWETKKTVFKTIDAICPSGTVFASNTSAIPITRIASVTQRPQQVLGLHFMNPVPLKKTVELVRGHHTSEESIAVATTLLVQMNKCPIIVRDSPGFVSNRVFMITINEAIFLLYENVASAEVIDTVFKDCFGHKMGPLETADLIGLDTILYSIEILHESFSDSKYRPCPLLKKMVAAGLLGKKSGQGFYNYQR